MTPNRDIDFRLLIAIVFYISGFSALVFQVVWQRVLTQVIGVDAVSVAFIVSIFMTGLGFGTLFASWFVKRFEKELINWYCAIEILIGLYGVISIPLIRQVNEYFTSNFHFTIYQDFLLNFSLLLFPIVLMGMTSPIIIQLVKRKLEDLGGTLGFFNGLNILGAALGAILSGFILVEILGLLGTAVIASALNILIGILVYCFAKKNVNIPSIGKEESPVVETNYSFAKIALPVSGVFFGFGTLALQMVFFRVLANYLTLSSIVFPAILASFLTLMAIGQNLGGRIIDRTDNSRWSFLLVVFYWFGVLFIFVAILIPPKWMAPFGAMVFSSFSGQLVRDLDLTIGDPNPLVAILFSLLFMVAVVPWSAIFPCIVRMSTEHIQKAGNKFANILFCYTIGNVIGAFITGLIMLGKFGTVLSLKLVCFIVFIGLFLVLVSRKTRVKILIVNVSVTIGILLIIWIYFPNSYYKRFEIGNYRPIETIEGRNGVVTVLPTNRFYTIIDMYRTASASAVSRPPETHEKYEAYRWNLSELFALDKNFRPEKILMIGIGHGYMANVLLDYEFVKEIVIVDISYEIVEAVNKYSHHTYRRIFSDPRVKIVIDDGRRYVQKAISKSLRFDLIQNKINEPWHSGSSNLFTVEFYHLLEKILSSEGYLAVRPRIGHAVNGLQVFKSVIWTGYYHIYFSTRSIKLPKVAVIGRDIFDAYFSANSSGGADNLKERKELYIVKLDKGSFSGYKLNKDNHPIFEYYWLNGLFKYRKSLRPYISYDTHSDYVYVIPVKIDLFARK